MNGGHQNVFGNVYISRVLNGVYVRGIYVESVKLNINLILNDIMLKICENSLRMYILAEI